MNSWKLLLSLWLVLERTVRCSRNVRFFVMFDMFEVRFWAKMWCSECSMFGHSMFGVFEVWYFGVRSKTTYDDEILILEEKFYYFSVIERGKWYSCLDNSSLGTNTKIPNFKHSEHWMSEHRTFQTSHFGPESNFEYVEHHKKPNSLWTSNCLFQD